MANYTQRAIMQTFETMLAETPFDRITVSALAARCCISPNTFYYYFRDIYDLLDSWLRSRKTRLLEGMDAASPWTEYIKAVLREMQANAPLVYHVFNSISRERLEQYIFSSVENAFYELVKKQAAELDVADEALRGIAGFCCYSLLGFILKFIWNRMEADADAAVDGLGQLFDGAVEYVLRRAGDSAKSAVCRESGFRLP